MWQYFQQQRPGGLTAQHTPSSTYSHTTSPFFQTLITEFLTTLLLHILSLLSLSTTLLISPPHTHFQPIPTLSPLQFGYPSPFYPYVPAPPVPQSASWTQSDSTFLGNPISFPTSTDLPVTKRNLPCYWKWSAAIATFNILTSHPAIESPLFDQVREQIYSEVVSLASANKSNPFYLMELYELSNF